MKHTTAMLEQSVESTLPIADDVQLFAACLSGDNAAAAALFKQFNPRLFAYCRRMLNDSVQAEDVTQDVWRRVIDLRRAPMQVLKPMAFLLTIARNLCTDVLRSRNRYVQLEDQDAIANDPDRLPTRKEEIALAAMDKLPVEYKETLVLNLFCGYRFDEIASMLGCSAEAIWQRASRARAQLRRIVADDLEREQ